MAERQRWRRLIRADLAQVDYPLALWSPARNYLSPHAPRTIRYIIIHITGGPSMDEHGALYQFRAGPASAHYIVNREGHILQMVREQDIANHVGNIHSETNRDSIGIEHVNPWNPQDQLHPTREQYRASAQLVAHICRRYSIPIVHSAVPHTAGLRGHMEEDPGTGHTACPNPAWDWDGYIELVRGMPAETFQDIIQDLAQSRPTAP